MSTFFIDGVHIMNVNMFFVFTILCGIFCVLAYIRGNKTDCKYKILLNICGSLFVFIAIGFLVIALDSGIIKNIILILSVIVGCFINTVLFFALGDIAQKVTEIHQHYQNKNI